MKVAVIGGGLTGLTAGYFLAKEGYQVTLFEKNNALGGLAGSFKEDNWQWPLEYYVHHIFTSDKDIIALAKELGLGEKIFFSKPKTSIFINGRISQFDSPLSILTSPNFNMMDKIKIGFWSLYLKTINHWQDLEKSTAEKWLKEKMGNHIYKTLWQPLLLNKFSPVYAPTISAAWFWARIKKRSFSLGYIKGGFKTLFDKLEEKIVKNKGQIFTDTEITKISKNRGKFKLTSGSKIIDAQFDKVIYSAPANLFPALFPDMPKEFVEKISKLKSIGSVGIVLELKEKFFKDDTYWLNINDTTFPFVCVVEQTNFIDKKYYDDSHPLYIDGYYPHEHPYFKMSKEEIFQEFLPFLQKINPHYHLSPITYHLFKNSYSQPIIPTNYSKIIPPLETPIPGVYFATLHHIYPWDRGTNYAVKLGKEVSYEILKKN